MNKVYCCDALEGLKALPDCCVQCVITSPPYWRQRDYDIEGQTGREKTPDEYVAKLVEIFREVYRVLRDDGIFWLNLGDSFAGSGKAQFCKASQMTMSLRQGVDVFEKRQLAGSSATRYQWDWARLSVRVFSIISGIWSHLRNVCITNSSYQKADSR